jgi:hypothetical protein
MWWPLAWHPRSKQPVREDPSSGFAGQLPMELVRWAGRGIHGFACPETLLGPAGTTPHSTRSTSPCSSDDLPLFIPDRGYRFEGQRSPDHTEPVPPAASPHSPGRDGSSPGKVAAVYTPTSFASSWFPNRLRATTNSATSP